MASGFGKKGIWNSRGLPAHRESLWGALTVQKLKDGGSGKQLERKIPSSKVPVSVHHICLQMQIWDFSVSATGKWCNSMRGRVADSVRTKTYKTGICCWRCKNYCVLGDNFQDERSKQMELNIATMLLNENVDRWTQTLTWKVTATSLNLHKWYILRILPLWIYKHRLYTRFLERDWMRQ